MTTIQSIDSTSSTSSSSSSSTGDSYGNNEIEFDPAFQSTYTFDPTNPATVFKDSYGTPGTDLSTQTYLMLDGMINNPYNTTDAQLFFIFTSELVLTGSINYSYNVGTAEDPEYVSLDDIISGITVTDPETGEETPLMACLVDVVIQEKYASEVAAGNTDWDPTVSYNGEPSFCDSLRAMFPPSGYDENGDPVYDSKVAEQVNAEIDTYDDPETGSTGKWDSYTKENAQMEGETDEEYAERLRADTSEQWADDVNNSNMVEQESIMREAMVHDMGTTGGLMASLMLLYMLLEAMGYSDLYTLTDQVNWYDEQTETLTELSADWEDGFDSPEEAYDFVGDVEDFVDEVNSCPQYADSSLVTTVNCSLGEDGFLGMETDYYYYDSETDTWTQATVGDLYDNPDLYYYDANGDSGYCDADGNEYTNQELWEANKEDPNTVLYTKDDEGNVSTALIPGYSYDYEDGYSSSSTQPPDTYYLTTGYVMEYEVHEPTDPVIIPVPVENPPTTGHPVTYTETQVYDKNGDPLTWGDLDGMQDSGQGRVWLYDEDGAIITYAPYSWQNTNLDKNDHSHWNDDFGDNSVKPATVNVAEDTFNSGHVDGQEALYDTFDDWSLDPSGQTAPAPQYGIVQSDFMEADTGFTNAAGTSTTLENQTANWIQEVESAMAKAIETYITGINTVIDNQTVQ